MFWKLLRVLELKLKMRDSFKLGLILDLRELKLGWLSPAGAARQRVVKQSISLTDIERRCIVASTNKHLRPGTPPSKTDVSAELDGTHL